MNNSLINVDAWHHHSDNSIYYTPLLFYYNMPGMPVVFWYMPV